MAKLVVPLAGQARVHWRFHSANVDWFNVFGFSYNGIPTLTSTLADTIFTTMKTAFTTHLAAVFSDTRMMSLGLRDVRTEDNAEFISTGAFASSTSALIPQPRQVAMVTTLKTAKAGKQWRGRLYLGGWDNSFDDSTGVSGPGAELAAAAFWNAVKDSFEAQGIPWALLQRHLPERTDKHGNILPERLAHAEPITDVVAVDDVWDTQRRRLH
jgi:hypothetical protein